MANAELNRSIRFSAAHRYYRTDWTEEENRVRFGPCANEVGHGHNYRVWVRVEGPVDARTSMVMDLAALDELLNEVVFQWLDHQHLNHVVPEFRDGDMIPTAEALAIILWDRIGTRLPESVNLTRVRVQEDDDLYVDYKGG